MTRADQLIRAVLDEAFAHSTSTPKRLDMILTSGVLKGQFSHHHWAKPSASRGSKKIVSFSDNPYYSHHDNGPALLFHRHAVGDQVYTPIKIDDHDHYDWVKNNLDKIDPSLHSEYGDHADTMTAMLHAGWIRKANSDSYTVGEGHEHRVRAYHLRTHPEEREIYIDVRHRNKKRSSYRYNLDTRTKVKLGESADSLINLLLEARDTYSHTTHPDTFPKILANGYLRGSEGRRSSTGGAVAFTEHPYWSNYSDPSVQIVFHGDRLRAKAGDLKAPRYALGASNARFNPFPTVNDRVRSTVSSLKYDKHPDWRDVRTVAAKSSGSDRELLSHEFGPWELEKRSTSPRVHFDKDDISHVIFHHGGDLKWTDKKMEQTVKLADEHGLKSFVMVNDRNNANRIREKYPHLKDKVFLAGAYDFLKSDAAQKYLKPLNQKLSPADRIESADSLIQLMLLFEDFNVKIKDPHKLYLKHDYTEPDRYATPGNPGFPEHGYNITHPEHGHIGLIVGDEEPNGRFNIRRVVLSGKYGGLTDAKGALGVQGVMQVGRELRKFGHTHVYSNSRVSGVRSERGNHVVPDVKLPESIDEITKPAKVSFSKMGPSPEIPDEIRNMTFFHGVHDGDRGEQILRSGRLVPSTYGVGSRWDKSLTPRDDKVYLAQDRVGAISYMQHQWNEHRPWYQGEPKSKYSYLFQVSGHDLNHAEADEDVVRQVYKQTHAWDAEPEYRHLIHPSSVNHEVAHQGRALISPDEHQVMVTRLRLKRLDHIAKKLANKLPVHLHHDLIIKNGSSVAHGGHVKITGAWRVHKDKLDQLNRYDDSNFDDIAEPVHHLIGKQESIDENTVAKGECFSWAFKRLLDHHVKGEHDAVLVHASVKHPWTGKRYEHAWVEHKGKVYDWQSTAMGLGKQHTVASFKAGYEPKQIKRYNGKQAVRASARAKHYGPW